MPLEDQSIVRYLEDFTSLGYQVWSVPILNGPLKLAHDKGTLPTNRLDFDEEVIGNPKQAKGYRNG
ncbi:hypothetical protein PENFLA_c014G10772 [Penicillium flavigenum]|uniref:Uncharacterized protein n=1 Tax=Penicillium flavigenum TaxID=254877 RepID=A0A1V6T6X6_9EURO|nr:hypothetical protein PENFLA_c014G10772 [Penicillium flavigenum]